MYQFGEAQFPRRGIEQAVQNVVFFSRDGGERNVQVLVEFFNDFFGFRFGFFGGSAQCCCGDAGELFSASSENQLGKRLGESFFKGYRTGKTL